MEFKVYKGNDKYHFRFYKKSHGHPFLVIMVTNEYVENGKIYLSGFNLTHSHKMIEKNPSQYIQLFKNPNCHDDSESFLNKHLVKQESKWFSKPIKNWHLCKEDELMIDELIS